MCAHDADQPSTSAIELEDYELTPKETAILDERLTDFRRDPESGTFAEQLKREVLQRLALRRPLRYVLFSGGL
jgi:hypothetical protein